MAHFIWDEKNTAHIGEHGVTPAEAEYVITRARPPYPRQHGDEKLIARGQTRAGRYIQVIYVPIGDAMEVDYTQVDLLALELDAADSFYVIHARPLTSAERGPVKRRRKGKGK